MEKNGRPRKSPILQTLVFLLSLLSLAAGRSLDIGARHMPWQALGDEGEHDGFDVENMGEWFNEGPSDNLFNDATSEILMRDANLWEKESARPSTVKLGGWRCGAKCESSAQCSKGLSCMPSNGQHVCASETQAGESCKPTCSLCADGGTCAFNGNGVKVCIPQSYRAAKTPSGKCGETCTSSEQCQGKLKCIALGGSQKLCGQQVAPREVCSRYPCFQNCKFCPTGHVCGKSAKCEKRVVRKRHAQCGETCSTSIPCALGKGLTCTKAANRIRTCTRRVGVGRSCDSKCQLCRNGLRCHKGKCRVKKRISSKCGQLCVTTASCRKGLSCSSVDGLGNFCTRRVGFGHSCDSNCKLCQPNLLCGKDFRCRHGKAGSQSSISTDVSGGSQTGGHPGVAGGNQNGGHTSGAGGSQGGGHHTGVAGGSQVGGHRIGVAGGSQSGGHTGVAGEIQSGGQNRENIGGRSTGGIKRRTSGASTSGGAGNSASGNSCFGFGPGLHITNDSSVNRTLLLLDGETDAQATFVYVPLPEEVVGNQTFVTFDLGVNDTTIATKATAIFTNTQGTETQPPCYRIMTNIVCESYVGVVSFNLTAHTASGSKYFTGYYVIAGISVASPRLGPNQVRTPVLSGTNSLGLVIGNKVPSGGVDETGARYEILSLFYQAPLPNQSKTGIIEALGKMSIVVGSEDASNFQTHGGNAGLLNFDQTQCSPLGPAKHIAGKGWSFANEACDIAVVRGGGFPYTGGAGLSVSGHNNPGSAEHASLVIRIPADSIGTSVAMLTVPGLGVNGGAFETTLRISANASVPVLLLNNTNDSANDSPKVQLVELDYYGREILNYTLLNTKQPQQAANATEYYLTLTEDRYAQFEGDVNTLGVQQQNVSFTTSSPDDVNKYIAAAKTQYAHMSLTSNSFASNGIPLARNGSGNSSIATASSGSSSSQTIAVTMNGLGNSTNSSETYAFIRVGNDTELTRATNLPIGYSLIAIFASPELALVDSNQTQANSSLVLRANLIVNGYSTRNFSEFKSNAIKEALQDSLVELHAMPITFMLNKVVSADGFVDVEYEAYLNQDETAPDIPKQTSISQALKADIGSGDLAESLRLQSDQVKLGTQAISFKSATNDSFSGVSESLGPAAIIAISALVVIPMLAICVGTAFAGKGLDGNESNSSGAGSLRAPPIDGDGILFIAKDGHGRGVSGVGGGQAANE